jgi:hypothetical protein
MARITWALLIAVTLAVAAPVQAADESPSNIWKVTVHIQGGPQLFWLLKLQNADGKWTGDVVAAHENLPKTTLSDLQAADGMLRFTLKFGDASWQFEGKPPDKDAKKFGGTVKQGSGVVPVDLERTSVTSLDPFDLAKDALIQKAGGIEVIDAATLLLTQAKEKKARPEEVRSWAAKAAKAAETYGPRWEREVSLGLAEVLAKEEDYAATALDYARKADRFLDVKDKPSMQKRTLELLAKALKSAKKADEAKEVEARIKKIATDIKPAAFTGRKEKSDRVVLVELFTGAECPPCVAADKAFDALGETYKPSEVVLLQYHLHIPRPDPLTSKDGEVRFRFYARAFGESGPGTPALFVNGNLHPGIAGDVFEAIESYDDCISALNPLLETSSKATLKASATRKGTKINITAEASDLKDPGERIKLRLVLVENVVAYKGGNGIPQHHSVVRALPGGPAGFALKEKAGKQTATIDLDDLRKELNKYLDDYAEKEDAFPNKERPMEMKNLRLVAFVQNDQTREVYQAVQVEVKDEKTE